MHQHVYVLSIRFTYVLLILLIRFVVYIWNVPRQRLVSPSPGGKNLILICKWVKVYFVANYLEMSIH